MWLKCQNCDSINVVPLADVPNLLQRVAPGEPMPGGQCRVCGSLMQPVTVSQRPLFAPIVDAVAQDIRPVLANCAVPQSWDSGRVAALARALLDLSSALYVVALERKEG